MRRPNVSGKTVRTVSTSPFRISCSSCLNARRPGMTRIVAHGSRLCHPPGARRTRPVNNRREQIGWYFYDRSEEHTSELQSLAYLVCRLLLEKKKEEVVHIELHRALYVLDFLFREHRARKRAS